MFAVEGDQPVIADRHTMGVPPEIPKDGGRPTERGLGRDHPVGVEERVHEAVPGGPVTQVLTASGEIEFVPVVRASQALDKLPAKDLTSFERSAPGGLTRSGTSGSVLTESASQA